MISEYTKSLKIYACAIIGAHLCLIGYFYPMLLITIIFTPLTFLILYKYVELIYQIEQANRDNLIRLINATDNKNTKQLLLQELWYADLHSLGGEPIGDTRI